MILLTGAAGYIGSHILVELLQSGQQVVVLDNLSTGRRQAIERVEHICQQKVVFHQGDIRDRKFLDTLFSLYSINTVIHLAGLKVIRDSLSNPLDYYDNNVSGSQQLLQAMSQAGVFHFVFSSSAAVYGEPKQASIDELHPTSLPTNPYGKSKSIVEQILMDLAISDPRWHIGILRYFNPVGAHSSGLLGEFSADQPENLVPSICRVAQHRQESLSVFGHDYPTYDGTAIRDYLHVVDLARGHLATLDFLMQKSGVHVWNLGAGRGYSVLEMMSMFEQVTGCVIPYQLMDRRAGDIPACWMNPNKAKSELGWQVELSLEQMLHDAWLWEQKNIQTERC